MHQRLRYSILLNWNYLIRHSDYARNLHTTVDSGKKRNCFPKANICILCSCVRRCPHIFMYVCTIKHAHKHIHTIRIIRACAHNTHTFHTLQPPISPPRQDDNGAMWKFTYRLYKRAQCGFFSLRVLPKVLRHKCEPLVLTRLVGTRHSGGGNDDDNDDTRLTHQISICVACGVCGVGRRWRWWLLVSAEPVTACGGVGGGAAHCLAYSATLEECALVLVCLCVGARVCVCQELSSNCCCSWLRGGGVALIGAGAAAVAVDGIIRSLRAYPIYPHKYCQSVQHASLAPRRFSTATNRTNIGERLKCRHTHTHAHAHMQIIAADCEQMRGRGYPTGKRRNTIHFTLFKFLSDTSVYLDYVVGCMRLFFVLFLKPTTVQTVL